MCEGCGDVRVVGRGIRYCDGCREFYVDAAVRRKRARARLRQVKPCRGCGGVKEPGKRRVYCDACRRARAPMLPRCQRCPERVRAKGKRLCVGCADEARRRGRQRQAEWKRAHPERDQGRRAARDPLSQRMRKRLQAERKGRALTVVESITGGRFSSGERVDADLFPALPVGPLVVAVERLIRRERSGQNLLALVADDTPDATRNAVCERLGISARRLYAWAHGERPRVQFDTADRVLQRAGWLWFDVWEACPGDAQHFRDVSEHGRCERCESYCLAEEAFTSERTGEELPGSQQQLDMAA
jgi:hypothetical protein